MNQPSIRETSSHVTSGIHGFLALFRTIDFFDIHHAVRQALFDHHHEPLLELIAAKLAVDWNEPVDLSYGTRKVYSLCFT
jgi:hypothetical protein